MHGRLLGTFDLSPTDWMLHLSAALRRNGTGAELFLVNGRDSRSLLPTVWKYPIIDMHTRTYTSAKAITVSLTWSASYSDALNCWTVRRTK